MVSAKGAIERRTPSMTRSAITIGHGNGKRRSVKTTLPNMPFPRKIQNRNRSNFFLLNTLAANMKETHIKSISYLFLGSRYGIWIWGCV
jgi:hypothetical protein